MENNENNNIKTMRNNNKVKSDKNQVKPTLISKIFSVMSVAFVVSFLFAVGIIPVPFGIGFSASPVVLENGDTPCLPKGDIKPVDLKKIEVNVLNSTNKAGLAGNTAKMLKEKNINVKVVGNTDKRFDNSVVIRTGKKDIIKAYTMTNLFSGAIVVYKDDLKVVEVILGEGFSSLLKDEQIKGLMSKPLKNSKKCISADAV